MIWIALSVPFRAITVGEDKRSLTNTLGTEKIYSAVEKLVNFHHNTNGAWAFVNTTTNKNVEDAVKDENFINGRIGMYTAKFDIFFANAADINFTTGVLPLPKYDAAQEEYLSAPDTFFTMFGVPITLDPDDYAFVGIVMEALNAESWKTVYPA